MNKKLIISASILAVFALGFFNKEAFRNFFSSEEIVFSSNDFLDHFYDNCGLFSDDSLIIKESNTGPVLNFQLRDKDIGKCSSDNRIRHRAPYWERAEYKQSEVLDRGYVYTLDFTFTLKKGFSNQRETVFQLHNYVKGCKTSPAVMLKFDKGMMQLWTKKNGNTKVYKTEIASAKILNQPKDVRWIISTTKPEKFSFWVNDKLIVGNVAIDIPSCGEPHLKFGIYRPGNTIKKNSTSIIEFSALRLIRKKQP